MQLSTCTIGLLASWRIILFPYSKVQFSGQVVLSSMCLVWPPCVIKPHVFHVPNGEQARDMRAYLEWSVSAFCGLKPLERPGAPQTILLGAEEKQQLQLQRRWRWESGEKTNVCWFHTVTAWRTCNPCVRTKWISHTVNLSVSTTYTNPFMQPLQGGNAAPLFCFLFFLCL